MERLKTSPSDSSSSMSNSLYEYKGTDETLTVPKSLVSEFAHEVRNPLAMIKGTIQLIKLKQKEIDAKYLDTIAAEVDRVNHTLEEFVTSVRTPKNLEHFSLSSTIAEVVTSLQHDEGLDRITVEYQNLPEDLVAKGCVEEFKQVLRNLSCNSIEAMSKGGKLTFLLKLLPGKIAQIQIRDNGIGIAPEIAERIFEPHFSTKEGAVGLGLAISRQIIQNHKGDIFVSNNDEGGCTFYINLPIIEIISLKQASNS